jgi:hypothetical protein
MHPPTQLITTGIQLHYWVGAMSRQPAVVGTLWKADITSIPSDLPALTCAYQQGTTCCHMSANGILTLMLACILS